MAKVLVTGAAGYIGSLLVQELLGYGHDVIGVDSMIYGQQNVNALLPVFGHHNFEFWRLDVRGDEVSKLAKRCDVIIPLAALVGMPVCAKYSFEAGQINDLAIKRLVGSLSNNQKVIYPNTNSGYGETDGSSECDETSPLNPVSVYGTTKCAGESHVLNHHGSVVFRLATVFGLSPRPRMDLLVNDFTRKLVKYDNPLSIFEGHFNRNFIGIRDVVFAFVSAVNGNIREGVYNLGNSEANMTKMELAHRVCDVIGKDRAFVEPGFGIDPDRRNYIVSNQKIINEGFPFDHSLEKGIEEIAWFCRNTSDDELKKMNNLVPICL